MRTPLGYVSACSFQDEVDWQPIARAVVISARGLLCDKVAQHLLNGTQEWLVTRSDERPHSGEKLSLSAHQANDRFRAWDDYSRNDQYRAQSCLSERSRGDRSR